MFADFQRKFRQRLSNALLVGAFWVNNTAASSTLLRLVGTYVPPQSGASVTSDILRLIRTSVGVYRIYLCPERTDRGMYFDYGAGGVTISGISTTVNIGTGANAVRLDNAAVQLFGGTSNVAVGVNSAVTVVQIGNTATAGSADVETGSTEFRGKTAASTATTNIAGGTVTVAGGAGASGSAGAANGGHVYTLGGQGFGTGVRGYVYLGWNGTSAGHTVLGGLLATRTNAPTIASAATIAPTAKISFVSGTTAIATITAPAPISAGGGQITLIPTDLWTTTTTGNIALATTAVVSKALILTYDATTAKWYPSY